MLAVPSIFPDGTAPCVRLGSGTLSGCWQVGHLQDLLACSSLTWNFMPHCKQEKGIMAISEVAANLRGGEAQRNLRCCGRRKHSRHHITLAPKLPTQSS